MTTVTTEENDQTRRRTPKVATPKCRRSGLPITTIPARASLTRAYFRSMRAAEMAAWEMTGGDYVLSCFVTQA